MQNHVKQGLKSIPLGGILGVFCLLFWNMGCEPANITDDGLKPADSSKVDSLVANISITNNKETFPQTLIFMLWSKGALESKQVEPKHILGKVPHGQTADFKVPAGEWKIGYQDQVGQRFEMPTSKENEAVWPVLRFTAKKSYALILTTDEGNWTSWSSNVPLVD